MIASNRRRVLRGILNGGAVAVALPFLNCFLNDNGNALADGAPIPVRFGTWFWGLGMNKSIFVPKHTGKNYEITEELAPISRVKEDVNVHTGMTAYRDGAFFCHYTGWIVARTGSSPTQPTQPLSESLDTTIANRIGRATRFKSLSATATGDIRNVVSFENATTPNPPEFSPIAFYMRLFGEGFQDPNATGFTPSPRVMVRKSALSAVMEQSKELHRGLGSEDRARLDQYFTGMRDLEQQFDHQLTKPEPRPACKLPKELKTEPPAGTDSEIVAERHRMMTDLMVMAIACDQTRVFNMSLSKSDSNQSKLGYEKPHHTCTHEEPVDVTLGYQPNVSWFTRKSMENWAYFVHAFKQVTEGDGTLLDNVLILANTDVSLGRIHSMEDMPAFTAGRAGGRLKTGLHIDHKGGQLTSLSYTLMKLMGVEVGSWGTKSNQTSKEIGEFLV